MLGRHWEHVSYGEVMPFYCKVGDRMLFVDGGNHYLEAPAKGSTPGTNGCSTMRSPSSIPLFIGNG
jgi:hypothetical protein